MDFGTGDGAYVRRLAASRPDLFVIGVDANASGLVEVSRRALAKPERGGLPNALFAHLPLEQAPGDLVGLAQTVSVLLPWGTLLRAVAIADASALEKLSAIGSDLHVVYGYGAADGVGLPPIEVEAVEAAWRAAGLEAKARLLDVPEVRALPTTWAKKLSFSDHARRFIEIRAPARNG